MIEINKYDTITVQKVKNNNYYVRNKYLFSNSKI